MSKKPPKGAHKSKRPAKIIKPGDPIFVRVPQGNPSRETQMVPVGGPAGTRRYRDPKDDPTVVRELLPHHDPMARLVETVASEMEAEPMEPEAWFNVEYRHEPYSSMGWLFRRGRTLTKTPGFTTIPIPGGHLRVELEENLERKACLVNEDLHTLVLVAPAVPLSSINLSYPLLVSGEYAATITVLAVQRVLPDEPRTRELEWNMYAYVPGVTTTLKARVKLKEILSNKSRELGAGAAEQLGDIVARKKGLLVQGQQSEREPSTPEQALLLRQVEAMERLAAATEESNRLARDAAAARGNNPESYGGRVTPGEGYGSGQDIAELFDSIPKGLFDGVNWEQ